MFKDDHMTHPPDISRPRCAELSQSSRVSHPAVSRRTVLGLASAVPLLLAGGCAPGADREGLRPDGSLRVATYITPGYVDVFPNLELFNSVVDAGIGDRTVDFFGSGALLNAEQLVPGMLRGVTDVGFQTSSYVSTSFPILGAAELPFVNDGFEQLSRALAPESEFSRLVNTQLRPKGIVNLGSVPFTLQWLYTVDRPVERPEDLRGLRIRAAGHVEGATVKALGAAPVSMSSGELYEALERGTIDGMVAYPGTVISRGLEDVLGYAVPGHFGGYSMDAYANVRWLEGTSGPVREALHEAAAEYVPNGIDLMLRVEEEESIPIIEESRIEILRLDEAQTDRFRDATASVVDWWRSTVGDDELADRALTYVKEA
ncbi:TRAP transporter substrate-binding protein [Brevibacterium album]|uniref:TRAP transporter substrate-binding protein n=1 Tax=Brevibacterium album TaxID=417948 RepID=UPI001FE1B1EC|nr:TRAP transporter substrate-binding protein DctP [Brevibacterium album]